MAGKNESSTYQSSNLPYAIELSSRVRAEARCHTEVTPRRAFVTERGRMNNRRRPPTQGNDA